MKKIKELLEARQTKLLKIKHEKQAALGKAPEGYLRVCNHKGKPMFYHRTNPKDFNGVYIKADNKELAKMLAQKDYDQKVLNGIEKELNAMSNYFAKIKNIDYEKIYSDFHIERQKLIEPLELPEEELIRRWENEEYNGKEFQEDAPEIYTLKGERVRSKSEMMIADTLNKMGIPYRYEYPKYLTGYGTVYPDFTVLDIKEKKEIIWEHFGIMDSSEYADNAVSKISNYAKNEIHIGEQLIVTFETKNHPLNQREIERTVQHYLL